MSGRDCNCHLDIVLLVRSCCSQTDGCSLYLECRMLDLRTGTELWSTFGPMGSGESVRRRRFSIDIEDRMDEQGGDLSWPWTLSREGCNYGTLTVDM